MKIRHPFWIKLTALLLSWLIRVWMGTLQHGFRCLGADANPRRPGLTGNYIYAFWHENLLLAAYFFSHPRIRVLISQHADGELMTRICRHLGFGVVRGSTTRGGGEAVRRLLRASRRCHLAVVPDGPRGPRRQMQLGLIYLASRTGLPIVAGGLACRRPRRARSWDRLVLPRLWSRAKTVIAAPVHVPPDLDRDQLELYRQRLETIMNQVNGLAEQWAENGRWPSNGGPTSAVCEDGRDAA